MGGRGRGGRFGRGRGWRGGNQSSRSDHDTVSGRRLRAENCTCDANNPLLVELRDLEEECLRTGKQNLRCGIKRAMRSVKLYPLPITTEIEACALEGVGTFTARRMLRSLPRNGSDRDGAGGNTAGRCQRGDRSGQENICPPEESRPQEASEVRSCAANTGRYDTLLRVDGSGSYRRHFSLAANFSELREGGDNDGSSDFTDGTVDVTPRRPTSRARREDYVHDDSMPITAAPRSFSGAWEPLLLLDNRERDFLSVQSALLQKRVQCETRQLPLGDMLWVARRKGQASSEVLLGYIVERKTASDLASSIVDGRYFEQKRRLTLSGLRRRMYLVEGKLSHQNQLAPSALRSALASSQIGEGLAVIRSASLRDTIDFLARTHRQIAARLHTACSSEDSSSFGAPRDMPGSHATELIRPVMTYGEYAQDCAKRAGSTTARQVLGAMVRQAPGCSARRAEAIARAFRSPLGMLLALERAADAGGDAVSSAERIKRAEAVLSALRCGGGPGTNKLSQPLKHLLCKLFLDESVSPPCDGDARGRVYVSETVGLDKVDCGPGAVPMRQDDQYCWQP